METCATDVTMFVLPICYNMTLFKYIVLFLLKNDLIKQILWKKT